MSPDSPPLPSATRRRLDDVVSRAARIVREFVHDEPGGPWSAVALTSDTSDPGLVLPTVALRSATVLSSITTIEDGDRRLDAAWDPGAWAFDFAESQTFDIRGWTELLDDAQLLAEELLAFDVDDTAALVTDAIAGAVTATPPPNVTGDFVAFREGEAFRDIEARLAPESAERLRDAGLLPSPDRQTDRPPWHPALPDEALARYEPFFDAVCARLQELLERPNPTSPWSALSIPLTQGRHGLFGLCPVTVHRCPHKARTKALKLTARPDEAERFVTAWYHTRWGPIEDDQCVDDVELWDWPEDVVEAQRGLAEALLALGLDETLGPEMWVATEVSLRLNQASIANTTDDFIAHPGDVDGTEDAMNGSLLYVTPSGSRTRLLEQRLLYLGTWGTDYADWP